MKRRRWVGLALLGLCACLALGACTGAGGSADDHAHDGLYGGVSGGGTLP
jgi:hypothetical protein